MTNSSSHLPKTAHARSILHDGARSFVLPFVLVTTCFALWGFANDITNPMVKAFSKIFRMSVTEGALVQMAFYGGYFCMAFPAALFIRRFSYKAGIMLGLALYAFGAFLFSPASQSGLFAPFLVAYFILTCGLSFLETSCNPYILSLGTPETATRRLNLAQSFNPLGSLLGMCVAMTCIQNRLSPLTTQERAKLSETDFNALRDSDLSIVSTPYLALAAAIVVLLVVFAIARLPHTDAPRCAESPHSTAAALRRLTHIRSYREGVVAQFFYIGAQIMCWTFIIQYGTRVLLQEGYYTASEKVLADLLGVNTTTIITERTAEVLSQGYNIVAMIGFCSSRFVCTLLMSYLNAAYLLRLFAAVAFVLLLGVIGCPNSHTGLYCLVGVSLCMSLMFPTIYSLALTDVKDDTQFGSAGLIMAILGGSVLPPLQAAIIDCGEIAGRPAVSVSFALPALCFIVIMIYAHRCYYTARYYPHPS